jgi:hypothetical protein
MNGSSTRASEPHETTCAALSNWRLEKALWPWRVPITVWFAEVKPRSRVIACCERALSAPTGTEQFWGS